MPGTRRQNHPTIDRQMQSAPSCQNSIFRAQRVEPRIRRVAAGHTIAGDRGFGHQHRRRFRAARIRQFQPIEQRSPDRNALWVSACHVALSRRTPWRPIMAPSGRAGCGSTVNVERLSCARPVAGSGLFHPRNTVSAGCAIARYENRVRTARWSTVTSGRGVASGLVD